MPCEKGFYKTVSKSLKVVFFPFMLFEAVIFERGVRKPVFGGFLPGLTQTGLPQKIAKGLKFRI